MLRTYSTGFILPDVINLVANGGGYTLGMTGNASLPTSCTVTFNGSDFWPDSLTLAILKHSKQSFVPIYLFFNAFRQLLYVALYVCTELFLRQYIHNRNNCTAFYHSLWVGLAWRVTFCKSLCGLDSDRKPSILLLWLEKLTEFQYKL